MSTNTTTYKPNKYIKNLIQSDGWGEVIGSLGREDQITIGTHGKNKEDNAKYINTLGIGKAEPCEGVQNKYDLVISHLPFAEDATHHQKDEWMFELGQINNYWSWICVKENHPLFEGLIPESPRAKGFSWYLI